MTIVTTSLLTPPMGSNLSARRFSVRCVALITSIWPAQERDALFPARACFDIATRDKYRAEFAALEAAGWHVMGAQVACFDGLEALNCQRIVHRLTPAGAVVRQALCPEADSTPDATARYFAWSLHHQFGDRSRDPRYPEWNPLEQLLRACANGSPEFDDDRREYAETIGEADCEGNRRGRHG